MARILPPLNRIRSIYLDFQLFLRLLEKKKKKKRKSGGSSYFAKKLENEKREKEIEGNNSYFAFKRKDYVYMQLIFHHKHSSGRKSIII